MKRPMVLIVRDGWGVRESTIGNAIHSARTPRLDQFLSEYPAALLDASEHHVGLPPGQMGNSEVGHLNIGAGRVVYQDFTRIEKDIDDGLFQSNEAFIGAAERASERNRSLHLVGLLSDGGVHSHIRHLFGLLEMAKEKGLGHQVYVHAILDGRDTSPRGGERYLTQLLAKMKELGVGRLASVIGRFFTMDRDKRWERVVRGYDLMVHGKGTPITDALAAVRQSYGTEVTDEFMEPLVLVDENKDPVGRIKRGDQIIFTNFRGDRSRQIVDALTDESFDGFGRGSDHVFECVVMCQYRKGQSVVATAYPPTQVKNHISSYLAELGHGVYKAAETEKYAHVTFFFNGGVEQACRGEERLLIPSPKVRTYDMQPEMHASKVADGVTSRLASHDDALIVVNFANTDMVGHTGNFDAVVRAVEVVDECVGRIVDSALKKGGGAFITADHGNAEQMIDPDTGDVFTAHTICPVHGLLVSKAHKGRTLRSDGALSNVAPTLLDVMGLPKPAEMTKPSLLNLG
jgi:2,3-bisphosphoglycerate-independent phosphoglycerate mutase